VTVRFVTDEHIARAMISGLQREVEDIDIVRVQDVGLRTLDDPTILTWAAGHDRVLVTHDIKTMPDFAHRRVAAGQPTPGVIVVPTGMPIGVAIAELVIVTVTSSSGEWANRVVYPRSADLLGTRPQWETLGLR
jgi:predicted nuclease of predicted toxin-antitoxin system